MFLSKLLTDLPPYVVPQIDVTKLLQEQQETIRKLDNIKNEVEKLKHVKVLPDKVPKIPDWVSEEVKKIPGVKYFEVLPQGQTPEWEGSSEMIKTQSDTINLNLIDSIKELTKTITDTKNTVSDVWSYFQHPTKIIEVLWQITVDNCYVICIVLTFGGIICGLVGYKKGYKIAVISFFVYYAIQIFNAIIGG